MLLILKQLWHAFGKYIFGNFVLKFMTMKQLRILILLLFFLQSKIGVAFNVHYCGKHIAEISWAFDAQGCGMEKVDLSLCDSDQLIQKSCCDDDVIIAQNDTDQTKVEGQKTLFYARTNQRNSFEQQVEIIDFTPSINDTTYPPPKIPHYKINCAFIFYA